MRDKPGMRETAELLITESEKVLGRRCMVFNKKDAMAVTGCKRVYIDKVFGGDRTLCAVDLARRICAGN